MTGKGAHLMIDETGSRLGCIDEEKGLFVDSSLDLTSKLHKKGWHNIVVCVDNSTPERKNVIFYLDGKSTMSSQHLVCSQPVGYIGNSKSG